MPRWLLALGATIAALCLVTYVVPTAQASVVINGRTWSDIKTHSDFAGNGQLQVNYRTEVGARGEATDGFYLESVRIHADSGGIFYQGIDGLGLSCWNDQLVVKFRRDASQTDLNPGQSRVWDTEIAMPDSSTLTCGWYFKDVFAPGDDLNQCAKVKVWHNEDWQSGTC